MNAQETQALWELGREAWNDWAAQIVKSRKNFEERGAMALNWFGDGENEETRLFLKVATADFSNVNFAGECQFDEFIFPGPAVFSGSVFERPASFAGAVFQMPAKFTRTLFHQDASFKGARFAGQALFDDATFEAGADFEKAEFLKERNGPLSHSAKFSRTRFLGRADLRNTRFVGTSDFNKTQFLAQSRFDGAKFGAEASFEGAIFSAPVSLAQTEFHAPVTFSEAQFTGEGRFTEAVFKATFSLNRGQFWGDANFRDTRFEAEAAFSDMRVEGRSHFQDAKFAGRANFFEARFGGDVSFAKAAFGGPALFHGCQLGHEGFWLGCTFLDTGDFSNLSAARKVTFKETEFKQSVTFAQSRFEGPVSFASVRFADTADFSAIQSRVAFVLADAVFDNVPSFLEASFHEPPRVDNMSVADPLKRMHNWKAAHADDPRPPFFWLMKVCSDPDASAKFRRLKKLAYEAQDQTREQEFFAQEVRCRRFWNDKPFGQGLARFWLGWFYGGVANFGRSLARPILLWGLSILLFTGFFLAQRTFLLAPAPQATGPAQASFAPVLSGLHNAQCVASRSDPIGEALYLSMRNALLRIEWDDIATARRVFGCLYGLEPSGFPIIPLSVSTISLLQSVISGALIFMFLLALRNLLKVR
jgi:hypothetical protein